MARSALATFALLAALSLAGCTSSDDADTGGEGDGGAAGDGSASAYIKDAPSDDFREVHVVVTEAKVHRSAVAGNGTSTSTATATGTSTAVANTTVSAGVNATATVASGGNEAGWITLFSDAAGVDIDLLNTTGARAAFLGESDLAAGSYQQVRMVVKEAYGIDHDGQRVEITVSSGTLRSVRSFTVEADRETRITIDIDLEKSLRETGNGQWRMTPVIGKTTAQVVDDSSSGEETAQPGDVESVPEAGSDGATVTASATVSATMSGTGTSSGTTSTGP
jgi:hypothetical protein